MKPLNNCRVIALFVLASCAENRNAPETAMMKDSLVMTADTLKEPFAKKDTVLLKPAAPDTADHPLSLQAVAVEDHSVPGKAFYNLSYCSGAAPPEEVLSELKKPRPLKNTVIIFMLLPDRTKRVKAKTGDQGAFRVDLPKGKWEYYLTKEVDQYLGLDLACERWFSKCYGSVTSSGKGKDSLEVLFHLDCDPCDPSVKMRP
jgi:hypothetical protein